jgi:hypothetical protein
VYVAATPPGRIRLVEVVHAALQQDGEPSRHNWRPAPSPPADRARNGANFYSARAADGTRKRVYAERNTDGVNSVTLEQTPGGKVFDDRQLYEPRLPDLQGPG